MNLSSNGEIYEHVLFLSPYNSVITIAILREVIAPKIALSAGTH